ncbi:MAG: hypothetical protein ACI8RZ_001801 [Myxococcota bacterium]|jgi:hypothetical protein
MEVSMELFVAAITGMIVFAALKRLLSEERPDESTNHPTIPETLTRGSDGNVINPATDARMRQAFDGLNTTLPFLGGQESWDLGPPPPVAELEEDIGSNQQTLSTEELAALQPPAPQN